MPSSGVEQCIDAVAKPDPLVGERRQRLGAGAGEAVIAAWRPRGRLFPERRHQLLLPQPREQRIDRALAGDEAVDRGQAADELEPVALLLPEERQHAVLKRTATQLRERGTGPTQFHAEQGTCSSQEAQTA